MFLFGRISEQNVEQINNIYRILYNLSQEIHPISLKSSFLFKKLKVEIKNFIKVIRDVILIILNHFQPFILQNYYIFPFHVEPHLCAPKMPCINQEVEQWGFPHYRTTFRLKEPFTSTVIQFQPMRRFLSTMRG